MIPRLAAVAVLGTEGGLAALARGSVWVMGDGPLGSPFAVAKANAMLAHDFA